VNICFSRNKVLFSALPLIIGFVDYILKIEVNNPKPIVRFILGLKEDVEVRGSAEFKEYLEKTK